MNVQGMSHAAQSNRALLTEAFAKLEHGDPSAFQPLFDDSGKVYANEYRRAGAGVNGLRPRGGVASRSRAALSCGDATA